MLEGESIRVLIAQLEDDEEFLRVTIDGCELEFVSNLGCVGVQEAVVEVEVQGVTEAQTFQFNVGADSVTQVPPVLAFTGPTTSAMSAILGAAMLILGSVACLASRTRSLFELN